MSIACLCSSCIFHVSSLIFKLFLMIYLLWSLNSLVLSVLLFLICILNLLVSIVYKLISLVSCMHYYLILVAFWFFLIIKNPKIFFIYVFSSQYYRELKIQNIQQRNYTEKAGRSKRPVKKENWRLNASQGTWLGV